MRLISKLLNILALFMLFTPSLIVVSQPKLMQECDFIMDFYTVGAMMRLGQGSGIYPPLGAESFFNAPFDNFCKQMLPYLPKESVAIYMYSPLLALIFAPFSLMSATAAMLVYQALIVLTIFMVGLLLNGHDYKKASGFLCMSALFCPVFHTLLIGQLGIVFGLAPLALAYHYFLKNKHMAAGLAFSLIALKPQYMPLVLLVCGALVLCRKPRAFIGLVAGLMAFCAVNIATCGLDLFIAWFHNFKMADGIYAKEVYKFGEYLVVCLPAVLLQFFPHAMREAVKLPVYALSALIGLFALWQSVLLLRFAIARDAQLGSQSNNSVIDSHPHFNQAIGLVMTLGLIVLTLVVPHFLFYDLCCFVLLGRIAFQDFYPLDMAIPMRTMRFSMWCICNIYYLLFMFAGIGWLKQWFALALVAVFAYFFYAMLVQMKNFRSGVAASVDG